MQTLGTSKPVTPQSFLYKHIDVREVVEKYAGTGEFDHKLGSGDVKEYFTLDQAVGRFYNVGKNQYVETRRVCIIYTNKGIHMFPVKEI